MASLKGRQLTALLLKSAALQRKQKCTNCCQIMTPLVCIIFTFLIKVISEGDLPVGSVTTVPIPVLFSQPYYLSNETFTNKLVQTSTRDCWYMFKIDSQNISDFVGQNDGINPATGILSEVIQLQKVKHHLSPNYNQTIFTQLRAPFFNKTLSQPNAQLYTLLKELNQAEKKNTLYFPEGTVVFHQANSSHLNFTVQTNDLRELLYHPNNGRSLIQASPNVSFSKAPIFSATQSQLMAVDLVLSSYIKNLTGVRVVSGYLDMPPYEGGTSFADIIINLTSSTLFSLALSLLLPVFLYSMVLQKEQKLVQMMKMNGMSATLYWVSVFIFNFLLSVVTFSIFFLAGRFLLHNNFFKETGTDIFITVFLGWAIAQIGIAIFFQIFLSTARTANIVGYLLSIWTSIIITTLNMGVFSYPQEMSWAILMYPPFAFGRIFYMLLSSCSNDVCYSSFSETPAEIKFAAGSLYISGLIFLFLGIYLYEIVPKDFGVSRPWYFPLQRFFPRRPQSSQAAALVDEEEEDQLARKERTTTDQTEPDQKIALLLKGMRKVYAKIGNRPQHVAVKNFNLMIRQNQIFGLLGPNGAGKTSLLSIITGLYQPCAGQGWVSGLSIRTQLKQVHTMIGVCPQFDLLWPDLTIQQHLQFYARLKGIPSQALVDSVQLAIKNVKLYQKRHCRAKELSGGMKRRLSVAISLVGNPKIIFMDQPTTGLDPDNRRQLWDIISQSKNQRSLLLTTHSMEEADVLCSRIGIITDGILRTVGSQITLKKKYVGGYSLQIDLRRGSSPEQKKILLQYLGKSLKKWQLKRSFQNNMTFEVYLQGLTLSQIFEHIERGKKEAGIVNWSISQPRLEEVFMNVVTKYGYLKDED